MSYISARECQCHGNLIQYLHLNVDADCHVNIPRHVQADQRLGVPFSPFTDCATGIVDPCTYDIDR